MVDPWLTVIDPSPGIRSKLEVNLKFREESEDKGNTEKGMPIDIKGKNPCEWIPDL